MTIPPANRPWYRNKHTGTLAYIKRIEGGQRFMYCSAGYVGRWTRERFDQDWEPAKLPTYQERVEEEKANV